VLGGAVTVTVAVLVAVPALPVQVSVYEVEAVSASVDFDPLVARLPDHPLEAVHELALLELQVSIAVAPLAIVVGLAVSETLGGVAATVTVDDCDAEPPRPVHTSVNFVVALSATVVCEPLKGSVPPQPPEATQLVALVDDQVRVDVAPLFNVVGLAVIVTTGAGGLTDTVTA
jgi:hypothetical protein